MTKHISFSDAAKLLHNLLDRYETKPTVKRPFAYVDENAFSSVETRDRFIELIRMAERPGAVKLENMRTAGGNGIRIRLVDADVLYRHLGRPTSPQKVHTTLADLYDLPSLPETASDVLGEIAAAWQRNVRKFGIIPHDIGSLRDTLTLACGLQERAKDPTPIDFRSFSRSVGRDSKALDRLAASVVAIYSRLYRNHATTDGLDTNEILATLGVSRMPQPFLLSGQVAIQGVQLPNLVYSGFPPDQAAAITLARPVDYVLTIENYTSFIRHARECNDNNKGLILYTAGFPARSHLGQILRLCQEAKALTYHWGDLDAGGLRIFKHIEQALSARGVKLRPHLMNVDILTQYGVRAENKPILPQHGGDGSAITRLWHALRETGLVLEQESLSPELPH
ncbi:Wadjet anti-phage system protein JetD domain-containing protein [Rhizobium panacihumi]|uniref:Wadjet anti-phage system protein JetD domain-containing protein n=1 Tax=Rhizobium panacihumi TaxID=2008450 RepID=UPI003D79D16A